MGLMNRVLRWTGEVAGDGLLKRALELRRVAQDKGSGLALAGELPPQPAGRGQIDAEKKKPLRQSSRKAA